MSTDHLRLAEAVTRPPGPAEGPAHAYRSLLVVPSVSLAMVGAVLAVAAGSRDGVALFLGLGLFIVGTAIGLTSAGPIPDRSTGTSPPQ